jgi:hypothetical protein
MLGVHTYIAELYINKYNGTFRDKMDIKAVYCSSINLIDSEADYLYRAIHKYIISNENFKDGEYDDNEFINRLYGDLIDWHTGKKGLPNNFFIVMLFDNRDRIIGYMSTIEYIEIHDGVVDIKSGVMISKIFKGMGLCRDVVYIYLNLLIEVYSKVIGVTGITERINDVSDHKVYNTCYKPSFIENNFKLIDETDGYPLYFYDVANALFKERPILQIYEQEQEHEYSGTDEDDEDEEDEDEEDDSEYSYERR